MEAKWYAIMAIGIMVAMALPGIGRKHGLCLMNCTTIVQADEGLMK